MLWTWRTWHDELWCARQAKPYQTRNLQQLKFVVYTFVYTIPFSSVSYFPFSLFVGCVFSLSFPLLPSHVVVWLCVCMCVLGAAVGWLLRASPSGYHCTVRKLTFKSGLCWVSSAMYYSTLARRHNSEGQHPSLRCSTSENLRALEWHKEVHSGNHSEGVAASNLSTMLTVAQEPLHTASSNPPLCRATTQHHAEKQTTRKTRNYIQKNTGVNSRGPRSFIHSPFQQSRHK